MSRPIKHEQHAYYMLSEALDATYTKTAHISPWLWRTTPLIYLTANSQLSYFSGHYLSGQTRTQRLYGHGHTLFNTKTSGRKVIFSRCYEIDVQYDKVYLDLVEQRRMIWSTGFLSLLLTIPSAIWRILWQWMFSVDRLKILGIRCLSWKIEYRLGKPSLRLSWHLTNRVEPGPSILVTPCSLALFAMIDVCSYALFQKGQPEQEYRENTTWHDRRTG